MDAGHILIALLALATVAMAIWMGRAPNDGRCTDCRKPLPEGRLLCDDCCDARAW